MYKINYTCILIIINKKYALFGVAAVIAIAGVIYFGTGANQQASVAKVLSTTKATPSTTGSTFPTENTDLTSQEKAQLNALSLKFMNLKSGNTESGTTERRRTLKVYRSEDGYCAVFVNGVLSGIWPC